MHLVTRRGRSIIRPVREVLRHIPSHSITISQKLLAPRRKKGEPASAPTDEGRERAFTTNQGRAVCIDGNRLATIMSFPTLAEAFGEFCRKSLCSEVRLERGDSLNTPPNGRPTRLLLSYFG